MTNTNLPIAVMNTNLPIAVRLEVASKAIAACTDMSEIKQMNDQAAALVAATAAMKAAPELVQASIRVKNEALLRMGEILIIINGTPTYVPTYVRGRSAISTTKSERSKIIEQHGISPVVASIAVRLAAGGSPVKARVLKAKTTNTNKLRRLAPALRVVNHAYKSDISREFMGGKDYAYASGMSSVLSALRSCATLSLRNADPRDKPRMRAAVTEAQELLDEIAQLLE